MNDKMEGFGSNGNGFGFGGVQGKNNQQRSLIFNNMNAVNYIFILSIIYCEIFVQEFQIKDERRKGNIFIYNPTCIMTYDRELLIKYFIVHLY